MDLDDYDRLKRRVRGPVFEASAYLELPSVEGKVALCDEGKQLLEKAQADLRETITSISGLLVYVRRMYGFEA